MNFTVGSYIIGVAGSSAGTLTTTGTNNPLTISSGATATVNSILAGSRPISKEGSGTIVLNGANTYSGTTTVNAGALLVNGNQTSATGLTSVTGGGTLGGSGTIGGSVSVAGGGILQPGAGASTSVTLNIKGGLSLASTSVVNLDLGSTSDLVKVTGAMSLDGTVNVTGTLTPNTTYTLFEVTGAITNNAITLGTLPVSAAQRAFISIVVDSSVTPRLVKLVYTVPGTWWDPFGGNSTVDGGAGTWTGASSGTGSTSWASSSTGGSNGPWDSGGVANFGVSAGTVTVDSTATINITGLSFTMDGYVIGASGTSGTLTGSSTANTLTAAPASVSATVNAILAGTAPITKSGVGTITLTGTNTYSGTLAVNAGTLLINGNQSGATGSTTVASGATLGGSGTIGGSVSVASGGIVEPGAAASTVGTLSVASLGLASSSVVNFDVGSSSNDLVVVSGAVTLDGTVNVAGTITPGSTYTLFRISGTLNDNGIQLGTLPGNVQQSDVSIVIDASSNPRLVKLVYVNSISGKVFRDNGLSGGSANDGIFNGGEAGLSGVSVSLTNCSASTFATGTTDASGAYKLAIPSTVTSGASLCVVETNATNTLSTGASVGLTALPSSTPTTVGGKSYTYTRNTDSIAFTHDMTSRSGLNFGDVAMGAFSNVSPGSTPAGTFITYPVRYTPSSEGTLVFSITGTAAVPASNWRLELIDDVNCNGVQDFPADSALRASVTVTASTLGQPICALLIITPPSRANNGDQNTVTVSGVFTYSGASPSFAQSESIGAKVSVNSGAKLSLVKSVCTVETSSSSCANVSEFSTSNVVKPGQELLYRIVYTNNTATTLDNVKVIDVTPRWTTFVSAYSDPLPAGLTACQKTTPASSILTSCSTVQAIGGTGDVIWQFTGSLVPRQPSTVYMRVRVDSNP